MVEKYFPLLSVIEIAIVMGMSHNVAIEGACI